MKELLNCNVILFGFNTTLRYTCPNRNRKVAIDVQLYTKTVAGNVPVQHIQCAVVGCVDLKCIKVHCQPTQNQWA